MAQGFLRTTLLHGTVLLCVPLFLSLPHRDAHALPVEKTVTSYNGNINAYRSRRIKARAESYQQRKQFPPAEVKSTEESPDLVENKHYEPLKVTIPNLVETPAAQNRDTQIVTRSSPSYKYLANSVHNNGSDRTRALQNVPMAEQLAEAGSAVTSSISNAGKSLIAAIITPSPAENSADVDVSLPTVDVAANTPTPAPELVSEAPPPPASTPSEGAKKDNPDEKPFRYYSPGIVIKKEVVRLPVDPEALASASPEQLARLAPAAGEPTAGVDAPLIQIPSTTEPAPEQEKSPEAAPSPPPPPAPAQAAVPAPEITPLVAPPVTPPPPPAAPAIAATPTLPPVEKSQAIDNTAQTITSLPKEAKQSAPAETLPTLKTPETAKITAPEEKLVTPAATETAATPKTVEEQAAELSPKSKQILKKIPPIADEKPQEPKGLDIDRSKDAQSLFEANVQEQDTSSEMAGVTIEVKAPSMNINYELEKAYNALLSGQNSAAIEIYKGVLVNDPINEDALFGLATTYHRAGQIEAARPLYGKLLAKNPNHRAALNNFLILVADEAPQEALIQLEALQAKNPDFSPIPAQLAVIYQKIGDLGKASEKMFKAVSLAPENLTYRYNLAILMDKQRNFDEAAKLYGQIVQAHSRGEVTPGNINRIQERLTFLRSNKH
ncbi:MAG: tetratricopeptide repeat protein [Alphaproteobacteria bacterium]